MKTLPKIIIAVILFATALSCREAEALSEQDEVIVGATATLFSRENEQKDPPKDPPKDRDNWRTTTGRP